MFYSSCQLGVASAGWFWLSSAVRSELHVSWVWRLLWGWRIHCQNNNSHGYWQEDTASSQVDLSQGCSTIIVTWKLAPPTTSNPRKSGKSSNVFYNLALEVTHHHFCSILLFSQASSQQHGRKHRCVSRTFFLSTYNLLTYHIISLLNIYA
jgi:hypothetical protein